MYLSKPWTCSSNDAIPTVAMNSSSPTIMSPAGPLLAGRVPPVRRLRKASSPPNSNDAPLGTTAVVPLLPYQRKHGQPLNQAAHGGRLHRVDHPGRRQLHQELVSSKLSKANWATPRRRPTTCCEQQNRRGILTTNSPVPNRRLTQARREASRNSL
jgi:hypothetical protein